MKKNKLLLLFLDLLLKHFNNDDINNYLTDEGIMYDSLNIVLNDWIQVGREYDEEKAQEEIFAIRGKAAKKTVGLRVEKEFGHLRMQRGPKCLSPKNNNEHS